MLEKISDENVPASFYETSGLMKFNLQPYKNGNYSKKYSSTDEILLTFIKVFEFFFYKNTTLIIF